MADNENSSPSQEEIELLKKEIEGQKDEIEKEIEKEIQKEGETEEGAKSTEKEKEAQSTEEETLQEKTKKSLNNKVKNVWNQSLKWKEQYAKKQEELNVKKDLSEAKRQEGKDNKKAVAAYLRYIKGYLELMESRDKYRLEDYYHLADHYSKIAELYQKIHHVMAEKRIEDMKSSAQYHDKAGEIYERQEKTNEAHEEYKKAGEIYEELGMLEKAADKYKKIGQMYHRSGDKLLVSNQYDKAAEYYIQEEKYGKAINIISESAKLKNEVGDEEGESESYKRIADIYREKRDHKKAIKYYAKSVEILSGIEKYHKLSEVYLGIAEDYERLEKYEDAIYYYLGYADLNSDEDASATAYGFHGAAKCYFEMEEYESAIKYYKKTSELRIENEEYLKAAKDYQMIAISYEKLEEPKKAADYYFKYARYGTSEEGDLRCLGGYKKAADIYIQLASSTDKEENYEQAADMYAQLAESYSGIGYHEKAGDYFYQAGELRRKSGDEKKKYKVPYQRAVDEYLEAGSLEKVGISYEDMGEVEKAVEYYQKFAEEQIEEENNFYVGEGYRQAAEALDPEADSNKVTEFYNKAAKYYSNHLEKEKEKTLVTDERTNVGNTYKFLAECYRNLYRVDSALEYYKEARDYFQEKDKKQDEIYVQAFLDQLQAKVVMRTGDYERATNLLEESIEYFDQLLEQTEEEKEKDDLSQAKKTSQELLESISKKPEVTLNIDRKSYTFKNLPVILNMEILNKSIIPIYNVSFLSHLPGELDVSMEPEPIEKIEAGGKRETAIELTPSEAGQYRLKPVEIIYKDKEEGKYVKSSNQVTLQVVEEPSADYKDYDKAVGTYKEYSKTQLRNENYFHAGEGYRGVAEVYGRFGNTREMEKFYKKAIETYEKHVKEMKEKEEKTPAEHRMISDSYRLIGQCYDRINNLQQSTRYLKKAVSSYEETKELVVNYQDKVYIENYIKAIRGLLNKTDAKEHIDQGNYDKASNLLEKAEDYFNEAIKEGGWTGDYERYLEKNIREITKLRKDIKTKPPLLLDVDYPENVVQNEEFTVTINIENGGNNPVRNLGFLNKIPENIQVVETPEDIQKLEPGKSKQVEVILIPKEGGKQEFKVFDISYKDQSGNNFIRGSEYVRLEVKETEKPAEGTEETEETEEVREQVSVSPSQQVPEVELLVDNEIEMELGEEASIHIEVINNGDTPVRKIQFLVHPPEGLKEKEEDVPDTVSEVKPGESVERTFTVKALDSGTFDTTPLEISYRDVSGNRYVKKCDLIHIHVGKEEESKEDSRIKELKKEKKRLERKQEMAKAKYHRRQIDESSYRNLVEEYERKLIEIDVELEELQENKPDEEKKEKEEKEKSSGKQKQKTGHWVDEGEGVETRVDYPETVKMGNPFTFNITVRNQSDDDIYNIKFLPSVTSELSIKKQPEEIAILEKGEEVRVSAEIVPKMAGTISYSLFKITYKNVEKREKIKNTERVQLEIEG